MDLRAPETVTRAIPAIQVHIEYHVVRTPRWSSTMVNGLLIFRRFAAYAGMTKPEQVTLDPFKVRKAFDDIGKHGSDASADALTFLCEVGPFWPFDEVTLEQINEWQRFSNLVRREDFLTLADKYQRVLNAMPKGMSYSTGENRESWNARRKFHAESATKWPEQAAAWQASRELEGLDGRFFQRSIHPGAEKMKILEAIPRRSEADVITLFQAGERPSETVPEAQQFDREQRIRNLAAWFGYPGGRERPVELLAPYRAVLGRQAIMEKPRIQVCAENALEAIAACTWVDRISEIKWQKCKLPECNVLFVESPHGKDYCGDACRGKAGDRNRAKPKWKQRKAREKAAAPERAERKKQAAKVAQKKPSAIQHPKTKTKRGSK